MARGAQLRGSDGPLEVPAERSGNLPGHRRDPHAFEPPQDPRNLTATQRRFTRCVIGFSLCWRSAWGLHPVARGPRGTAKGRKAPRSR